MNPSAKPDMECGCCPGGCDECCDCCFVRQNHIFFSICLPILCVVWIVLFVVFAAVYFPVGMILIFYIAGPVTIVTSITACCCLCFCQKRQDEQAPKPTVRSVQYVQQQRPVAQPTVQYVQPMPQQYAPQRYQPVSHAVVVQPQQYQPQPPPPPIVRMPQPAPPPPPQYVAAEATVVEAAPEGANVIEMEPVAVWRGASGWDAAGLVAALRAAPPGHKAPAVISHCMRHTEQPRGPVRTSNPPSRGLRAKATDASRPIAIDARRCPWHRVGLTARRLRVLFPRPPSFPAGCRGTWRSSSTRWPLPRRR